MGIRKKDEAFLTDKQKDELRKIGYEIRHNPEIYNKSEEREIFLNKYHLNKKRKEKLIETAIEVSEKLEKKGYDCSYYRENLTRDEI